MSMSEKNEWKPISSAPRDGTEILAWRSDCGQFIASYTSPSAFPLTQKELDETDEADLFAQDWFTQWPHACRLEGSEVPTLWQSLPDAPCPTCNDQGAVGNILNAQPCPDCTPAASAPGDAQDERRAFEAWAGNKGWPLSPYQNNCGIVVAERYGHRTVQKAWEAWQERASAPAAGDALDAARYRWLRDPQTDVALVLDKRTGYVPEDESVPGVGGYHTYEYRAGEELDAAIDAALAAQVPQQGEA